MKALAEIIKTPTRGDFLEEDQPANRSQTELQRSQQNTATAESKFKGGDVISLSAELGASLVAQRTYGKQGGDIAVLTEVFLDDLKEYEPAKVLEAIKKWRLTSPEFPTPADIMAILNPQPKFDYAVYTRLLAKSKSGDRPTQKEWDYIAAYESNAMKGL